MNYTSKKFDFFSKLICTLGASLLGNLFAGKGVKAKISGGEVIRAEDKTVGAGKFHALTNFEIQKYYQKEHTIKVPASIKSLP